MRTKPIGIFLLTLYTVLATVACNIFTKQEFNRKHSLGAFVFTHIQSKIIKKPHKTNSGRQKTLKSQLTYRWNHCKNSKNEFREFQNFQIYQYFYNWVFYHDYKIFRTLYMCMSKKLLSNRQ